MSERETNGTSDEKPRFTDEFVRLAADTCGVQVDDTFIKSLAIDVTELVTKIFLDAAKFKFHEASTMLLSRHVDKAIHYSGFEKVMGVMGKTDRPFRKAEGGGHVLHFVDDYEVDLANECSINKSVKPPPEIKLRSHWLAVDGVQPAIPENPPPLTKEQQYFHATNPTLDLKLNKANPAALKENYMRSQEKAEVKPLSKSHLSREEEIYFSIITVACVGSDEIRRVQALNSLQTDPVLYEMLPRICKFIAQGIYVNVVQSNLTLLIYLMRMIKALLGNETLNLELYIHEIIGPVITCCITKSLCTRPEFDNHWALRDFTAIVIADICKKFNNPINALQVRITRQLSLGINENRGLTSLYGCIAGLAALDRELVRVIVIPSLKLISERIQKYLQQSLYNNENAINSGHIRSLIRKHCPRVLMELRTLPDNINAYTEDYGCLGKDLFNDVVVLRGKSSTELDSNNSILSRTQQEPMLKPTFATPMPQSELLNSAPSVVTKLRNVKPNIVEELPTAQSNLKTKEYELEGLQQASSNLSVIEKKPISDNYSSFFLETLRKSRNVESLQNQTSSCRQSEQLQVNNAKSAQTKFHSVDNLEKSLCTKLDGFKINKGQQQAQSNFGIVHLKDTSELSALRNPTKLNSVPFKETPLLERQANVILPGAQKVQAKEQQPQPKRFAAPISNMKSGILTASPRSRASIMTSMNRPLQSAPKYGIPQIRPGLLERTTLPLPRYKPGGLTPHGRALQLQNARAQTLPLEPMYKCQSQPKSWHTSNVAKSDANVKKSQKENANKSDKGEDY